MIRPRILALSILLAALGLIWAGTGAVQAHAMLMHSIPDTNAALVTSPVSVDLYFSEAIDPNFSKVNVLDVNGNHVDNGDAKVDSADSTHLGVTLKSLPDGVYTVTWTVVSATDGHQTNGSYPFSVGPVSSSTLTNAPAASTGSSVPLIDILTKGILYIAAAAIMGSILFTFLVWIPSLRGSQASPAIVASYDSFSKKMIMVALIVFVMAEILNLLAQAGQVSGTLLAWPWQSTFITVLIETRVGVIAISRIAMVFILSGLLLSQPNGWNRWVALAISLLFLLTFSLESHAAARAAPILPILADWFHMIAVSVWLGGLFSFLGSIWIIRNDAPKSRTLLSASLIPHFSNLALTSVGILTLTGIYSALLHIGSIQELITTTYGQAFVLKGLIGFGMVGLGAYNFLVTTPRMRQAASFPMGSPRLVAHFSRLLLGEVTLAILILIWVSVFTSLSPAKITPLSSGFSQSTKVDDLTVTLAIDPNKPGNNQFTATVKSGSTPVTNALNVSLEFTPISGMVPASKAAMTNNIDGTYSMSGGYLGMPDQWDIKVVVIRQGKYDSYADFTVNNVPVTTQPIPWRSFAAGFIALAALGYAFAFRMLDWNIKRWVGLGVVPAIALGAVGILVGLL